MALELNAVGVSVLVLGGAVALVGVAVAVRALFADRSRGRRRCPSCWYDMSGVPGLACPECGRSARYDKRLLRTRRHWWRALGGVLIVVLGGVAGVAPLIKRKDAIPYLPTAVLVFMTPTLDASGKMNQATMQWTPDQVIDELNKRINGPGMREWEWRVFIERLGVVRTRRRWPVEKPLAVELRPAWCIPGLPELSVKARLDDATMLEAGRGFERVKTGEFEWRPLDRAAECPGFERIAGTMQPRMRSVVFDVKLVRRPHPGVTTAYPRDESGQEILYDGPIKVQVGAVEGVDAAIEPLAGVTVDAEVKGAVRVYVIPLDEPEARRPRCLVVMALDRGKLGADDDMAIVPGITFSQSGNVVKRVRLARYYMRTYQTWLEWYAACLEGEWVRDLGVGESMREWEVKLDGLGEHVLCQWNRERCWRGSVKYRLSEVISESPAPALMEELTGRDR